jgi:hypothetical protein
MHFQEPLVFVQGECHHGVNYGLLECASVYEMRLDSKAVQ